MKTISLIDDFTAAPGARYKWQGEYSGEEFRDDILLPPLKEGETVEVNLDGAYGLPSSFIDEAFGPLAAYINSGKLIIILTDNDQAKFNLSETLKNKA